MKLTISVRFYTPTPSPTSDAIGHLLAEDIYPVFHGLQIVGVADRDVQVLFDNSPCPRGRKCSVFFEAIKSFTKYYPQVRGIRINFPPRHPDLVCYKLLYLGTGQLRGSSRVHHPDSWGHFVEKVLYGMGLDPFNRPEKQRILVINKGGNGQANRIAFNGQEIAKKLGQQFEVEVDNYRWKWHRSTPCALRSAEERPSGAASCRTGRPTSTSPHGTRKARMATLAPTRIWTT
jgi:hypothetical protein